MKQESTLHDLSYPEAKHSTVPLSTDHVLLVHTKFASTLQFPVQRFSIHNPIYGTPYVVPVPIHRLHIRQTARCRSCRCHIWVFTSRFFFGYYFQIAFVVPQLVSSFSTDWRNNFPCFYVVMFVYLSWV